MQPRLSLVTLGVSDLGASRRFYEALGFRASSASQGDVVFFQLAGGGVLALWLRHLLAEDARIADGGGAFGDRPFGGFALAHNVRSEAEVDAVLAEAACAGARILKAAAKAFWGGYSGYFADPDGHPWEVVHAPMFTLDADGRLALPP